ncbi:MAG: hypothetical protein NVS3B27_17170 [Novosphingobium sp.]
MIISGGENIYSIQVEEAVNQHPSVLECAVIGVPDEARGQVVKAYVIANRAGSAALVKELQDFTREKLAQHEFPRLIDFVTDLPKTPAGKVNRKVLRTQAAEAAQKSGQKSGENAHV